MDLAQRAPDPERLAQALPALVHFGSRPLVLAIGRPVTRIDVRLPGRAALALRHVELIGGTGADVEADMTSVGRRSGPASGLLRGQPIATACEVAPGWSGRWTTAIEPAELRIHNRMGERQFDAYPLRVTVELAGGELLGFDNLDPARLRRRLGAYAVAAARLLRFLDDRRCAELLRWHLAATEAALGDPRRANAACEARIALVEALADALDSAPVEAADRRLRAAGEVADSLVDRRSESAVADGRDPNSRALAIRYAALLLDRPAVQKDVLGEDEVLLREPAAIARVARETERRLDQANAPGGGGPLMFRSHGLSRRSPLADVSGHVGALAELTAMLAELGHEAAICYGTLLGAVRTGSFIPHDDDLDMVVRVASRDRETLRGELASLARRLVGLGATVKIKEKLFLKVWPPRSRIEIDLFPIMEVGDDAVMMHMESLTIRPVPRASVLPFGTVTLHGQSFAGPNDPATFLADRYGDDWRIPQVAAVTRVNPMVAS